MDFQTIKSEIAETAAIYQGARIQNSVLGDHTVVGNFSRVDFSTLAEKVRIDRNNHLFRTKLGRHSYTGMNTVVMHADIGGFCSISWNVSIGGANHDPSRLSQHAFLYNPYDGLRPEDAPPPYDRFADPLVIGNDVWIAAGAAIMRGVTVGNGAVIGANAVVTRDVPPYAIVAGNPARVIRMRFAPEIVALLLELRWWHWDVERIRSQFTALSEAPTAERLQALLSEDPG